LAIQRRGSLHSATQVQLLVPCVWTVIHAFSVTMGCVGLLVMLCLVLDCQWINVLYSLTLRLSCLTGVG